MSCLKKPHNQNTRKVDLPGQVFKDQHFLQLMTGGNLQALRTLLARAQLEHSGGQTCPPSARNPGL